MPSIRALPNELQEKANNELNEVPSRIQDDLTHIRNWLAKQLHLKSKTDDQTLISFLRNGKFSLQRAKEKLDAFYTMKSLTKEILKERNPFLPEIQEILQRGIFTVVSDPAQPLLPVVLIVQWEKMNLEEQSVFDLMRVRLMILDILVNEYDTVIVNGLRLIEDFKGFSMSYVPEFTPTICKLYVMMLQDVYPLRFQGGYVVNAPAYFETVYNLIKPLMKEKIKNRVKIYGSDFGGICQDIPLSVLPKEYGGEAESIDKLAGALRKKMESYSDWFFEDSQYGTDETKRPGKAKSIADMFGADGSFRKLDID